MTGRPEDAQAVAGSDADGSRGRAKPADRGVDPDSEASAAIDASSDGVSAPSAPAETRIRLHPAPRTDETEHLLAALRAAPPEVPLVLDAGEVETPGTPYVLALAAAARARSADGRPVAVINPSPAFVDAFSDLGLFEDLMSMEFRQ